MTYQCTTCRLTDNRMIRQFGTLKNVLLISPEEQKQFYEQARSKNVHQLRVLCDRVFKKYEVEETLTNHTGEFLPLAVWEKRGFDPERIRSDSRPEDRKVLPQLGECYQVKILKTGVVTKKGSESSSQLKTERQRTTDKDDEFKPIWGDDDSESESDEDSSSSSSSTSESKKKKKTKHSKKSKKSSSKLSKKASKARRKKEKEREQQRKAKLDLAAKSKLENADKQANLKKSKSAWSLKQKLEVMIASFRRCLENPLTSYIPAATLQPLRMYLVTYEEALKKCALVIDSPASHDLPGESAEANEGNL